MFFYQPSCSSSGSDQSISQRSPLMDTTVGLWIVLIVLKSLSCLLIPPCTQRMRSSMTAATGRALKQSTKIFHILVEYLRLPNLVYLYTLHKIHIQCWSLQTRDCLAAGRSSMSTLFCNRAAAPSFRPTAYLDPHSLPERGSWLLEGNRSIWRFWVGPWTARVCLPLLWWVPWVRVVLVERGRCV